MKYPTFRQFTEKLSVISSLLVIIALILMLFPVVHCKTSSSRLENRIINVESGLLKAVVIKGQPLEKLNIIKRMKHYSVPGVSIAFINGYGIQWVRCYGVREQGSNSSVTPDTLFQAASISKPIAAAAVLHFVEKNILELDSDVNDKLIS